jgi:ParB/RepB/Spo0J family partition protein
VDADAAKAFLRTMNGDATLPLANGTGQGPAKEGITRLGGAFSIAVSKLRTDPRQPRREFDERELENLTRSIRERGIRQPIRVWHDADADVYQIVSGERRFRAAVRAGLTEIPCMLDKPAAGAKAPDRRTVVVDQVVENWQREDLNAFELSDALKELRDHHDMTQDEIAKLIGKPKGEISKVLSMQRVAEPVQREIRAAKPKTYSRRHVLAIARLPRTEQQKMAERILEQRLTVAETEREVGRTLKRLGGGDTRGSEVVRREYVVGSAKLTMTFRKRVVTTADQLGLLDAVRKAVKREVRGRGES